MRTYQNQEESSQNDSDSPTKLVNAKPKDEHAKDVANKDGIGKSCLHSIRHLLRITVDTCKSNFPNNDMTIAHMRDSQLSQNGVHVSNDLNVVAIGKQGDTLN